MADEGTTQSTSGEQATGLLGRVLNAIEVTGNKLPDPAVLFLMLMVVIWVLSWPLSKHRLQRPATRSPATRSWSSNQLNGAGDGQLPVDDGQYLRDLRPVGRRAGRTARESASRSTPASSAPALRQVLSVTPKFAAHADADSRRHRQPLRGGRGICARHPARRGDLLRRRPPPAGRASPRPSPGCRAASPPTSGFPARSIPLLQGFTQTAAQLPRPERAGQRPVQQRVHRIRRRFSSSAMGWLITDRLIEPRLKNTAGRRRPRRDAQARRGHGERAERAWWAGVVAIVGRRRSCWSLWLLPQDSALRLDGTITSFRAPIMRSIVPLIFLGFIIPGHHLRLRRRHGEVAPRHHRRA